MCVCVRRCLCLAGLPMVILLVFWVGGLFQERSTGNIIPAYTHAHFYTCTKGNWESHQRSTAEGGAGRSLLPDV